MFVCASCKKQFEHNCCLQAHAKKWHEEHEEQLGQKAKDASEPKHEQPILYKALIKRLTYRNRIYDLAHPSLRAKARRR